MSMMTFQVDARPSASGPKLAGDCIRLADEGAKRVAVMPELRATFKPWSWELATTLMYALALPHSLSYHIEECGKITPVFEEYERQLEWREGARIKSEMQDEGFGNPNSANYKKAYSDRMSDAKYTDDRYKTLSHRIIEHKNGIQSASALFMSYMIAWQNRLGLREERFVALCERIVSHLNLYLPVRFPEKIEPNFTSVYRYMKEHFYAARNEKSLVVSH